MVSSNVVSVTNHAKKRFKQRLGLPKSACLKHAQTAFDEGVTHAEAKGRAKRYLDKLYLQHENANAIRVYGEFIYLFAGHVLVTVIAVPRSVRAGLSRQHEISARQG